jgi:beta-glucosidase
MRRPSIADTIGGLLAAFLLSSVALAEDTPIYRDLNRSFEERAADLVARMTLEEKISQLQNDTPAIPRLGVPSYEWWNEALHGVARAGAATVFPQAIGLAATFDPALMHEVATAISDEGRAKHHEFERRGQRARYQGLNFWSPNINIFRDPRWGRGQETYGEDPYLTSRMGVAFVTGLQGDDPRYVKVGATAKHYAVHSGPEASRHEFDVHPSEQDLFDTYLPAFRALVREGHVTAVMGAYNRVNGESASASPRLLQEILRNDWGFDGYVVSDCDSIDDIFMHHKIVSTAEQAAALGIKSGLDLNCGKTYAALAGAVRTGLVTEAQLDVSLRRLMLARMRLGMFDPPERVRWASTPYSVNQSREHDQLARRAAQASIVLLKNDRVLPLKRDIGTIAVIGPTADEVMALLGNYYGTPAAPVTILQGIRSAAGPKTKVLYSRGADLVEGREEPRAAPVIESTYLRPAAGASDHGLRGEYFRGRDANGSSGAQDGRCDFAGAPVLTRTDARVAFRWDRGSPTDDLVAQGQLPADRALSGDDFCVRWTGQLVPPASGNYEISVGANDGFRLYIDGKLLIDNWELNPRMQSKSATVQLAAGHAHDIKLEYFEDIRDAEVRLAWRLPGAKPPFEEALDAARAADVVVFVGGLTGDVEGEEMKVSYPGFSGGDRTDLRLPASQHKLLEAVQATGKPVVLVLTTGSALAVDWAQEHVPAILVAWYPGQRGGDAVADVLFGTANPSGRLPVTFYKESEKLPAFDDYSMRGRTYRYFAGEPLYPFGHGLSYTRFEYSGLKVEKGDTIRVSLNVKNAGALAGDEVVQLYVRPLVAPDSGILKELRGVERITLKPGETRRASFTLQPDRDFAHYSVARKTYAVEPGNYELQVGASSRDIRLKSSVAVEGTQRAALDSEAAERFARLALNCLHREYPNKIAHVMDSDADAHAPHELTPAFYGCYDWHSDVHGHWLLVRLLRLFPSSAFAARARSELAESFEPAKIAGEVAYLKRDGRASFERPYGLSWLLQLAAELRRWDDPQAKQWSATLAPLENEAAARLKGWLPKLGYPIRIGEHDQTAFSFGLIWDWATVTGDSEMRGLLRDAARRFYQNDRNCPLNYEPSGQDFLSPCLAEADFMRRVLDPAHFASWLTTFLPEIPKDAKSHWLDPGVVTDRADPKLAHLDGLNLSRAWMLEGIAKGLGQNDPRVPALLAAARRHRDAALPAVTGEHYEGGHWLGTFAVYLTSRAGLQ